MWEFEGYYRPGDVVESSTSVSWGHNSDLGTPGDGPYFIYLGGIDTEPGMMSAIPDDVLLVGVVEVHLSPHRSADGSMIGPNHAIARFEIPDVPAGLYQILHCNDPCTTTLGDVIGGWNLRVLPGSDGRPAEEIAEEVKAAAATMPLVFDESPAIADTTAVAVVSTSEDFRERVSCSGCIRIE